MLPSSSSNSSNSSQSSFSDSPICQYPPQQAWFPSLPQRRNQPKYPRYYSTPLNEDSPDSTPLQMYGLEAREPSIYGKPRRFSRFSHALGDIKEDFSLQIDPRSTSDRMRAKRRQSALILDTSFPSSTTSSASGSSACSASSSISLPSAGRNSPMLVVSEPPPPPSRSLSILSPDTWSPPVRRLSRRLSGFSFSHRKKRYVSSNAPSISQPNLIGSSTHI